MKKIIFLFVFFSIIFNLYAQLYKVEIIPEKKQIYLGDKVKFYLKISTDTPIKSIKILDNSTKFEIYKKDRNKIIYFFYNQFFKTGEIKIKPIKILINGIEIYSNELTIYVKSNLEKDYKFNDVKPPEDVKFYLTKKEKIYLIIALIILIGIIFVIIKIFKKRKIEKQSPIYNDFDYLLPYEEALKNVKVCEKFLENGELRNFYSQLSFTLKKFIQRKMKIELIELTIDEIVKKYKKTLHKDIIEFLKKCDEIRFSGKFPDYIQAKKDFERLKELIEDVENS